MPTPPFVIELRALIGHRPLWLATAAGVVVEDGRVLLGRRADTGEWALPGGIVDPAEHPADAAVREVYEETGVLAAPERLTSVSVSPPRTYANGDQVQYLELAFRCRAVCGDACVNDSESVEVGWHALDDLPDVDDDTRRRITEATGPAERAAFIFSGLTQVLAQTADGDTA